MPKISIAPYFPFDRVKITYQRFTSRGVVIGIEPDLRYIPQCGRCGAPARRIHSEYRRLIRDLNLAGTRVWLDCRIRKVVCTRCRKVRVERLGFVGPGHRVTERFARYVHGLCKLMPVSDVCLHTGLNHKTVKAIDKHFLKEELGRIDFSSVRLLAVDEISERKGYHYLTIVIDYETGRVLYVAKKRRARTLKRFFRMLSRRQRRRIKAVALDMWDPYIKAVRHYCPTARIVFDLFHVKKEFGKEIDKVRNQEYRKASEEERGILKGSRYLLLSNRDKLSRRKLARLEQLLRLNEKLSVMYVLKDQLSVIWSQRTTEGCLEALQSWVALAAQSGIREVLKFAKKLMRYAYGIINHALYPIHTGKLEGTNNTIKAIKRRSYGFRDSEYFGLKIKQAFPGKNIN